MKNTIVKIIALFLLAGAFRISFNNNFFWVDEFSTATQAQLLLEHGSDIFNQSSNYFEAHNITTHLITAGSFFLFGFGEWQAKLPMMLLGSFIPVLIYIFAKKIFNKNTALVASLLSIFSYWQITWSRQARGYVLQQLLVLLTLLCYQLLLKKFSKPRLFFLITVSLFGLLTHTTYILILLALGVHFILFNREKVMGVVTKPLFLISAAFLLLLASYTGQLSIITDNLKILIGYHPNNLAYYHSFLWREQTIISLLAFLGTLLIFFKKKKYSLGSLLLLPVILYLFFVSFLFAPYVSRYLLPIFPLLIVLSGMAVSEIAALISKKQQLLISAMIVLFIVINGDKFTIKPKAFYSVNHDMREIALINYDQVYGIIESKGELEKGKTAVVDTWPDRIKWYLGENQDYFYTFRWLDEPGTVNGLEKKTPFELNKEGEKYIPKTGRPPVKLIGELLDLELAMAKYQQGFIWIDDSSLPADVISYVKENFYKELYLDHYPLDDNPYSIWPGTLYSWGFEANN
jgi:hypothetical protein